MEIKKTFLSLITFFWINNKIKSCMLRKAWDLCTTVQEYPRWEELFGIIIIKLCIMFLVFKLWLMPNYLNSHYDSAEEKSNHVFEELTTKP
ncbi:MAG: DUF4492 domain-containing protein [Butyricimonas faecihominis]